MLSTATLTLMKARVLLSVLAALLLPIFAEAAGDPNYTPMKVIQTTPAVFPRRVENLGIKKGQVHVSVQVDERGKLTDHVVTAYSHPAFAEAAVTALKRWDYHPAMVDGRPRSATVDLTFNFERQGLVVVDMSVTSYVEMRSFNFRPEAYSYRACTLRQLDRIPTPKTVVQPVYPVDPAKLRRPVEVAVMFFIDEEGRVRLPAVTRETSAANEDFAAAAIEAVSKWQFEPPLSKGEPALVAAVQEFKFHPASSK